MQGKTKSFLEDTTIILVLAVFIGGAYFIYDKFSEKNDVTEIVEKIEIPTPIPIENNTTDILLEENNISQKSLDNQTKLLEKKEIVIPKVIEIPKKEQQIDTKLLKTFLEDVKLQIENNIVRIDENNMTKSPESLRFRITILKNGNYEQLTFVNGDEKLFTENKDNILKIFPLTIEDTIQEAFPRYIRFTIK